MRFLLLFGLLFPSLVFGQHSIKEYYSQNGEFRLMCVPSIDTTSAYAILYDNHADTLIWEKYGLSMTGHIGVSNSGKIAWFTDLCGRYHYTGGCLEKVNTDSMVLHMAGLSVKLGRILSERLYELPVDPSNRPKGVLANDTIIHKMAENPFFIDEDKVFVCTKPATLNVFDLNTGQVLYVGPGRNHFTQNYYSIPSPPHTKSYPTFGVYPDSSQVNVPFWDIKQNCIIQDGRTIRKLPAPVVPRK